MKCFLTQLLVLIAFSHLTAQDALEKKLTRKVVDCKDIAGNSAIAFIDYMRLGQYDSAKLVIDFWESKCGISEPVFRSKILWTIILDELTEQAYGLDIMDYIYKYHNRLENSANNDFRLIYSHAEAFYGNVPLNSYFDHGTQEIAGQIVEFDNDLEKLFCLLYSGDVEAFFQTLQQPDYSHYIVRYAYDEEVSHIKKQLSIHYTIFGGSFAPTGNARYLGSHPEFGFSIGAATRKFTYDLRFAFRWGSTDQPYHYSLYGYDTIATTYYFGGMMGLDVFYQLAGDDRLQLLLLGGMAIDGFDTAPFDNSYYYYYDNYYSVIAFNFNLGIMCRFFITRQTYLFAAFRYNFVNYNNNMRSYDGGKIIEDISGNWYSLSFGLGSIANKQKKEKLRLLNYMGK